MWGPGLAGAGMEAMEETTVQATEEATEEDDVRDEVYTG